MVHIPPLPVVYLTARKQLPVMYFFIVYSRTGYSAYVAKPTELSLRCLDIHYCTVCTTSIHMSSVVYSAAWGADVQCE
jgi:hypothetical protein